MSWAGLGANDFVTGNDLQNAVSTGIFTIKAGQTIPANNTFLTKAQVNALVNVDTIGGTQTDFPIKSQLVSSVAWSSYIFSYVYSPFQTSGPGPEAGMARIFGSPCHNVTIWQNKDISSGMVVGDAIYSDSSGTKAAIGYYAQSLSGSSARVYWFDGNTIITYQLYDTSTYGQLGHVQLVEWIGDAYYADSNFPTCYTVGAISTNKQVYAKSPTTGCIAPLNPDYGSTYGVVFSFLVSPDGGYGGRGTPYRINDFGIILPMITLDFTQFFEFPWAENSGFDVAVNAEYIVRATTGTSYTNTFLNDIYNNLYAIDRYGNEISIGNNYFENINNSTSKVRGGTTVFYDEESVMPVVLMSPSAMDISPSIKSGILIAYYNRKVG